MSALSSNEAEQGNNVEVSEDKVEVEVGDEVVEKEEEDSDEEDRETCESGLSAFAMAALNEYLAESTEAVDSLKLPAEDFKMSQFWFDEDSREMLAREALRAPLPDVTAERPRRNIALISAPSVWYTVEELRKSEGYDASVVVMEIDHRFESSMGAEFVYFDYNCVSDIPKELHGTFDYIMCGPPYVSTECVDKYLDAFKLLARHPKSPCSFVLGAILEDEFLERGFKMNDMEIKYSSKFCTPMRYYCNY